MRFSVESLLNKNAKRIRIKRGYMEIEPIKDKVYSGVKIKQDSVFSMDELYKLMYRWFEAKGYSFSEVEYRKFGQGENLEILWYAEKAIDHYAKIVIEIGFLIIGLEKIEIEVEGTKTKSNKGGIEMKFDVILVRDYQKKFRPWLRKLYEDYIIKSRIEDYRTRASDDANGLFGEIKSFLKLHQF